MLDLHLKALHVKSQTIVLCKTNLAIDGHLASGILLNTPYHGSPLGELSDLAFPGRSHVYIRQPPAWASNPVIIAHPLRKTHHVRRRMAIKQGPCCEPERKIAILGALVLQRKDCLAVCCAPAPFVQLERSELAASDSRAATDPTSGVGGPRKMRSYCLHFYHDTWWAPSEDYKKASFSSASSRSHFTPLSPLFQGC